MQPCLLEILKRLGDERRLRYSLNHFTEALAAAQNPERSVNTIVISGTNGKGTVSLLVSAALVEAGYLVGTYLSPHLQHPKERFLTNLQPASWETLDALGQEYEPLANDFALTYFEFLTLLAFLWSRTAAHQYLVLEVGMGGRLDATNVTQPKVTVITNIDFDHQKYLGNTLDSILKEKMGILRTGVPLFTGIKDASLMAALELRCSGLGIRPHYGWQTARDPGAFGWEGQTIFLDRSPIHLTNPSTGTVENAALAFSVLRQVFPEIMPETIQRAFSRVQTPGRMETVQLSPRTVLSGDHNLAGIYRLVETLRQLKTRPKIVCAFSPDKPYPLLIEKLQSVSDDILVTQIPRFSDKMPSTYSKLARFQPDPHRAVEEMLGKCGPQDTLLVTGSLYLVGEVRCRWHEEVRFLRD